MPPTIKYFRDLTNPHLAGKAVALLRHDNINGGTGPNNNIFPQGFISGNYPYYHQRGHLIGNALGGSGNDIENLVTITDGTNHPIMYEFEEALKLLIINTPHVLFRYTVECKYDLNLYEKYFDQTSNSFVYCASGNPYCQFPAPAQLCLSVEYIDGNNYWISLKISEVLKHLKGYTGKLSVYLDQNYGYVLVIPNGVYKQHRSLIP